MLDIESFLNKYGWSKSNLIVVLFAIFGISLFAWGANSFFAGDKSEQSFRAFKASGRFKEAVDYLPIDLGEAEDKLKRLKSGFAPETEARKLYILGVLAQRKGDWEQAIGYFKSIEPKYLEPLADRALLHQIECYAQLGKEYQVIDLAKTLINGHPDSLSASQAYYELARSYSRQKQIELAEQTFLQLRQLYPESTQSTAAAYYLGEIANASGRKEQATELWSHYLQKEPGGALAQYISKAWLGHSDELSSEQHSLLGLHFYAKKELDQAWQHLQKAQTNSHNWLAKSKLELDRDKVAARTTLSNALKKYVNQSDDFKAGFNVFLGNFSIGERDKLIEELLKLIENDGDYLLWRQASYKRGSQRLAVLKRIVKEYPYGDYAGLASSQIFWKLYESGNTQQSVAYAYQHISRFKSSYYTARVMYWLAKLKENTAPQEAKELYTKIQIYYPASFYAYRATERLNILAGGRDMAFRLANPHSRRKLAKDLNPKLQWKWPLPANEVSRLDSTIQELFALNLWKEAFELLPTGYERDYPALHAWYIARIKNDPAQAINKMDNLLRARKSSFHEDEDYWLMAYPFLYWEYAHFYGLKYNVDPLLVLALMRQESRFQAEVVSRSNAIGLCQLLPQTAREVARQVGTSKSVNTSTLTESQLNVQLGAKYIANMLQRFDGRAEYATAAYNGGPNAVGKWKQQFGSQDPDEFIRHIPYSETENYVIQVMQNYWVYDNLYKQYYAQ